LEQELESDEDSVQSSDREEQKANSVKSEDDKPQVVLTAEAVASPQAQAAAKQIFAPDAAIEGSHLDSQLDEKQDGSAEAKS